MSQCILCEKSKITLSSSFCLLSCECIWLHFKGERRRESARVTKSWCYIFFTFVSVEPFNCLTQCVNLFYFFASLCLYLGARRPFTLERKQIHLTSPAVASADGCNSSGASWHTRSPFYSFQCKFNALIALISIHCLVYEGVNMKHVTPFRHLVSSALSGTLVKCRCIDHPSPLIRGEEFTSAPCEAINWVTCLSCVNWYSLSRQNWWCVTCWKTVEARAMRLFSLSFALESITFTLLFHVSCKLLMRSTQHWMCEKWKFTLQFNLINLHSVSCERKRRKVFVPCVTC